MQIPSYLKSLELFKNNLDSIENSGHLPGAERSNCPAAQELERRLSGFMDEFLAADNQSEDSDPRPGLVSMISPNGVATDTPWPVFVEAQLEGSPSEGCLFHSEGTSPELWEYVGLTQFAPKGVLHLQLTFRPAADNLIAQMTFACLDRLNRSNSFEERIEWACRYPDGIAPGPQPEG